MGQALRKLWTGACQGEDEDSEIDFGLESTHIEVRYLVKLINREVEGLTEERRMKLLTKALKDNTYRGKIARQLLREDPDRW